jgi:hypothetical protein
LGLLGFDQQVRLDGEQELKRAQAVQTNPPGNSLVAVAIDGWQSLDRGLFPHKAGYAIHPFLMRSAGDIDDKEICPERAGAVVLASKVDASLAIKNAGQVGEFVLCKVLKHERMFAW